MLSHVKLLADTGPQLFKALLRWISTREHWFHAARNSDLLPDDLEGSVVCVGYSWPYNARILISETKMNRFNCYASFHLPLASFTVGPEPLPTDCDSLDAAKTKIVEWLHGNILRSMMVAWEPVVWEAEI